MSLHEAFSLGAVGFAAPEDGHVAVSGADGDGGVSASSGLGLAELDWSDVFLFGGEQEGLDGFTSAVPDSGVQHAGPEVQLGVADAAPYGPGPRDRREHQGMAEFFLKNGAWRPPEPCVHCRQLRLQCFMLQTTSANPNPVHSCSSCVALFRQCSLAERSKRQPSRFETASPVIGHLHGVSEEGDPATWNQAEAEARPVGAAPSKRASSRSVRKTQVLRDWFLCHLDHPYPTDKEKTSLAHQSGLSRTQVVNWFTNARRRHRLSTQSLVNNVTFRAGSPMPRSLLSSMTPLERWRHSPPESEHVTESAIQEALGSRGERSEAAGGVGSFNTGGCETSASGDSLLYAQSACRYSSEGSASSSYSRLSANSDAAFSARSLEDGSRPGWGEPPVKDRLSKARKFTCRYCSRSFLKKYDWLRHERSVHVPGDISWVCAIPLGANESFVLWRLGHDQPECIFCGQPSPTEEHLYSHEFEACSRREVQDRSFSRKDHMWQHLYKFHGCRKWEGWKPDLSLLQHNA